MKTQRKARAWFCSSELVFSLSLPRSFYLKYQDSTKKNQYLGHLQSPESLLRQECPEKSNFKRPK